MNLDRSLDTLSNALNFLLHGALDGGGTLSLKTDAQGKVYSTALLRMEVPVPAALALLEDWEELAVDVNIFS